MPTSKVLMNGTRNYIVHVTGDYTTVDGGADATNAVIVDRSALIGPDRINLPTYIRVDRITYTIAPGYTTAILDFDDATDENILMMNGEGYFEFDPGITMTGAPTTVTEGDIQFSTTGGAAGDTYSFTLHCSLKN